MDRKKSTNVDDTRKIGGRDSDGSKSFQDENNQMKSNSSTECILQSATTETDIFSLSNQAGQMKRKNSTKFEDLEKSEAVDFSNTLQDINDPLKNISSNECNLQSTITSSLDRSVQAEQKKSEAEVEISQNSKTKISEVFQNSDNLLQKTVNESESNQYTQLKEDTEEKHKASEVNKTLPKGTSESEICKRKIGKAANKHTPFKADAEEKRELSEENVAFERNVEQKNTMAEDSHEELENFLPDYKKVFEIITEKVNDDAKKLSFKSNENTEITCNHYKLLKQDSEEDMACERNLKKEKTMTENCLDKPEIFLPENEKDLKLIPEKENSDAENLCFKSTSENVTELANNHQTPLKQNLEGKYELSEENMAFERNLKRKKTMTEDSYEKLENSLPENEKIFKIKTEKEGGNVKELSIGCNETNSVDSVEEEAVEKNNCYHKENPFRNIFDIKIPLIGKRVIKYRNPVKDQLPAKQRYELAMEINRRRCKFMQKMGYDKDIPLEKPWEVNKTEEQKKREAKRTQYDNLWMSSYISRLCSKILKELSKDNINDNKILECFEKFLRGPVTPTTLLYTPHLVHTILFCWKCKELSKEVRCAAKKVYNRCHAMFPIPSGYNFETVYTQQVKDFLPDTFESLEVIPLDYDDFEDNACEKPETEINFGNRHRQ